MLKKGLRIDEDKIKIREIQLGLPAGTHTAQWAEIKEVIAHANLKNIQIVITIITP